MHVKGRSGHQTANNCTGPTQPAARAAGTPRRDALISCRTVLLALSTKDETECINSSKPEVSKMMLRAREFTPANKGAAGPNTGKPTPTAATATTVPCNIRISGLRVASLTAL
mmetsp:Transcript_82058/g.171768  ORF Transcript_82058/g.171768 Transcript_82058/m.171768 type:complete len:113 (+) Transcript_82058:260-598(+)